MCGFLQDKTDTFDWTRRKGRISSSSTGPFADHTGNGGCYNIFKLITTSNPVVNLSVSLHFANKFILTQEFLRSLLTPTFALTLKGFQRFLFTLFDRILHVHRNFLASRFGR